MSTGTQKHAIRHQIKQLWTKPVVRAHITDLLDKYVEVIIKTRKPYIYTPYISFHYTLSSYNRVVRKT